MRTNCVIKHEEEQVDANEIMANQRQQLRDCTRIIHTVQGYANKRQHLDDDDDDYCDCIEVRWRRC